MSAPVSFSALFRAQVNYRVVRDYRPPSSMLVALWCEMWAERIRDGLREWRTIDWQV